MHKIRQKRISQQEQDELAEVLYYVSPEDEREINEVYSSSKQPNWDQEERMWYD